MHACKPHVKAGPKALEPIGPTRPQEKASRHAPSPTGWCVFPPFLFDDVKKPTSMRFANKLENAAMRFFVFFGYPFISIEF